jgi:uncharacterized membrane protein
MKKEQLATFNDAVIAIVITLMVLDIKLPELTPDNLWALGQHILIYGLSFLMVAIVWLNLRLILMPLEVVDNKIIWLDLTLLFVISLIPLPTQALGEQFERTLSHVFYGITLMSLAIFYSLLHQQITKKAAILDAKCKTVTLGKNWLAIFLYAASIPLSYVSLWISTAIFILIPILYFLPSHHPVEESE